jgi:hypothetical protein
MSALIRGINRGYERFRTLELTLPSGKVYKHGAARIVNGEFVDGTAVANGFYAGIFQRDYDATSAPVRASVDIGEEVICRLWSNATASDACSAATIGDLVFFTDNNTVSPVQTNRTLAGRCWGFDATTNRVLVQRIDPLALNTTV